MVKANHALSNSALAVIYLTVFDAPVSQIPSAPNQNSQNLATCLSVHLMRYPSAYNVVQEIPFSLAEEENDIIKTKFVKLWDRLAYPQRTR